MLSESLIKVLESIQRSLTLEPKTKMACVYAYGCGGTCEAGAECKTCYGDCSSLAG